MTAIFPFADLSLPPLLTSRPILASASGRASDEDPIAVACQAVRTDQGETGDLFWATTEDRVDFAIILAPEVPVEQARLMVFVLMVATADALGAIAPPELAITWQWPDRILANRGEVGRVRLRMSEQTDASGVPHWMVLGLSLSLKPESIRGQRSGDPGLTPEITSLWDEGAVFLDRSQVLESLSRHFLTWLHRWEGEGFRPVLDAWLFRCDDYERPVVLDTAKGRLSGQMLGLDEAGNLVLKQSDGSVISVALTL